MRFDWSTKFLYRRRSFIFAIYNKETSLKNVYEVLREKEVLVERIKAEVDALRIVAPLLSDETEQQVLAQGGAGLKMFTSQ